jgi:type I restriction enzyme R subunit
MQAIARVNRVFRDKPGGLIVDYIGIADQLRQALAYYTEADRLEAGIPQEQADALLLEKYEVVTAIFHGFDYSPYFTGTPAQRISVIPGAIEHILSLPDGKARYMQAVTNLSKAFALAVPSDQALALRDEIAFFQAVRANFVKATLSEGKDSDTLDTAIRQIVSRAVSSDGIIDIFGAVGLKNVDISIFSDAFLEEVKDLPQRNLALEMLRKLLSNEIKARAKRNIVEARSFEEMLDDSIRRYQNRSIETAQIVMELIDLAKHIREARNRGDELGLTDEEVAFYDALAENESAVQELGDETLRAMAREIVQTVRRNVTIDWTAKESVRAKLRVLVRRLLRKYRYPPDQQERATQTVLEQAELLGKEWTE